MLDKVLNKPLTINYKIAFVSRVKTVRLFGKELKLSANLARNWSGKVQRIKLLPLPPNKIVKYFKDKYIPNIFRIFNEVPNFICIYNAHENLTTKAVHKIYEEKFIFNHAEMEKTRAKLKKSTEMTAVNFRYKKPPINT